MIIDGIGLGGYRSFGAKSQKIGPFSKINLIAGQNNCGKSNILRFVHEHYGRTVSRAGRGTSEVLGFGPLDAHLPQPCPLGFLGALRRDNSVFDDTAKRLQANGLGSKFATVVDHLTGDDQLVWFHFTANSIDASTWDVDPGWLEHNVLSKEDPSFWRSASEMLTTRAAGLPAHNAAHVMRTLFLSVQAPKVALIPAIRQIGTEAVQDADYTGRDIIQRLADLQHPAIHEQAKRERFDAINAFVQTVLDEPTAQIEIPVHQNTIHVQLGQHKLPLEHLGTGIHEVTMLAAWATTLSDHVVCIEEPELHLHPLQQKKLLRYLGEQTSNQYLFTTHSAHILEQPGASIFHVHWDGTQSLVHQAVPLLIAFASVPTWVIAQPISFKRTPWSGWKVPLTASTFDTG